jgi:hypothetical protein
LAVNLRTTTAACIKYVLLRKRSSENCAFDLLVSRQFDFEKIPFGLYTMEKMKVLNDAHTVKTQISGAYLASTALALYILKL